MSDTDSENVRKVRIELNQIPNSARVEYFEKNDNKKEISILKMCKGSRNSFCITSNGKMQICQNAEYPQIDIEKYGVRNSLRLLSEKIEEITCPEKCKYCTKIQYCDICIGGIYKDERGEFVPYNSYCEYAEQIEREVSLCLKCQKQSLFILKK